MERQCELARVSRAGFYRQLRVAAPEVEELELRDRLQRLVLAGRRRCGYRVVTAALRREGLLVNHKRVLRLMREDNLLALRARVFTTDSRHELPVYPNLARRMRLTGPDQLWVADITYVRLGREFVYLAVVLDAWSRRVIGWALSRGLEAQLAVAALEMALTGRPWRPGVLVHHSDRGVQYASTDYSALLEGNEIQISMSRAGNPYDNARAERFMRTLKEEEVQGREYRDLEDARTRIGEFLENVYNRTRLHSALRYLSPAEFEAQAKAANPVTTRAVGSEEIPAGFPHFPPPQRETDPPTENT